MNLMSFSMFSIWILLILNLQHIQAQEATNPEPFAKGSLISNVGEFPASEYRLTTKDNVHHFSGAFNGLPQFNFGPEAKSTENPSPLMLTRMMEEAIVFDRVGPMMVNTENGPIKVGDRLTISSQAGVATVAKTTDQVIVGIALESFQGKGSVIIRSRIHYQFQD